MAIDFSYSSHDHPQVHQQDQQQENGQNQEHEHDQQQHEEEEEEEEDYIDMEVTSYYSDFLKTSPIHQPNEFEFITQSGPLSQDHLSADELFYNGKLLPLHRHYNYSQKELFYTTTAPSTAATTPTLGTPFLSCNASPVESCHVSKELNPEEYFLECSNGEKSFHGSKKFIWSSKLKLIKNSTLLTSKIRASQAYIKCLFNKSIANNKDVKSSKTTTFGETKESSTTKRTSTKDDVKVCHRRSFSGAFKMRATTNSKTKGLMSSSSSGSSSSSSSNSNEVQLFKRSISADMEVENAVAGAIAHCKQSQSKANFRSRKTLSEIGLYNSMFEDSEEK